MKTLTKPMNIDEVKEAAKNAVVKWRGKLNRTLENYPDIDIKEFYKNGNFLDLPPECLFAVATIQAFRSVESWVNDGNWIQISSDRKVQ